MLTAYNINSHCCR